MSGPASQASVPPVPDTGEPGETSVSLWSVVVILALVFAFFGVRAALGSTQMKDYAQARVTSTYILSNGGKIGGSMEHLHTVNARDYDLVKAASVALDTGNTAQFNHLVAQAEVFSVEQLRLQQEMKDYQAAFDLASQR